MWTKISAPFFLLLSSLLHSEIRTIHSLDAISPNEFSTKTLLLFDIDDVLIYPKDPLLQNWRAGWKPEGMREWTPEEDTIAWMHATFQLMDPSGPTLIDQLNTLGIPTIGFTSFAMEQPHLVESIPAWRSSHLIQLGLHFNSPGETIFPAKEGVVPPSFEKGVLYCGDIYKKEKDNKGKILSLYLDWLDWKPERVVLIDDGKNHIMSVKKELERRGIPFLGFLYIPKELDPIDEKVAALQYETLILQKVWLSEK